MQNFSLIPYPVTRTYQIPIIHNCPELQVQKNVAKHDILRSVFQAIHCVMVNVACSTHLQAHNYFRNADECLSTPCNSATIPGF